MLWGVIRKRLRSLGRITGDDLFPTVAAAQNAIDAFVTSFFREDWYILQAFTKSLLESLLPKLKASGFLCGLDCQPASHSNIPNHRHWYAVDVGSHCLEGAVDLPMRSSLQTIPCPMCNPHNSLDFASINNFGFVFLNYRQ